MSERKPLDLPEKEVGLTRTVKSLRELVDVVTGRALHAELPQEDAGLAEVLPFPFLAIVGQEEMKLALLLAIINPMVNGVLLVGPRGTGKTTVARSLVDLLPGVKRSNCFYGCLPEDIQTGGLDAVCPDCARKFGEGIPLTRDDQVRVIELPLNAGFDDVVGGLDERALEFERKRLRRGILAQADQNLLYVDEVNLLADNIINSLLDAASAGFYTLRRGQVSATYRSRFTLIGSMNPEEGNLRPQIMDRFGLRIVVRGLPDTDQRLEAARRSRMYRLNPRGMVNLYFEDTRLARDEIAQARALLTQVEIPDDIGRTASETVQKLEIDSLRAEMTLFEAARALAAADGRLTVTLEDIKTVAPFVLRLRRSSFMIEYFKRQELEDHQITEQFDRMK